MEYQLRYSIILLMSKIIQMHFKIRIVTAIFFLLIGSQSNAHPISQNEISPQKIEQNKRNLAERILHKHIKKHIKTDEEVDKMAKLCLSVGILSFVAPFSGFFGGFGNTALALPILAVTLGILGLRKYPKKTKSWKFSLAGLILGGIVMLFYAAFIVALLLNPSGIV